MNKYQEFVKNNIQYVVFLDKELNQKQEGGSWKNVGDELVINQAEDYNITKYYLVFNSATINSLTLKGKEYKPNLDNAFGKPYIIVCLDFNDKQKEIIFNSNVVDSFSIPLKYNETDHKIYDGKVLKEKQDELARNAQIKISTGNDLVNIYFQPCCDRYAKTIVELYLADGQYSSRPMVIGKHDVFVPRLLSASASQLLGRFESEKGMFFKSITGLAHHAYGVKVSQVDKEGKELFTTDFQYFDIR